MDGPLIHEFFESQARASARKSAVKSAGGELTYEHLDWASDRMAIELVGRGCGAGSIIGIYLEPSLEYVVSIIAILKAGGVYLPLSTNFPTHRLTAILGLAETGIIVTNARLELEVVNHLKASPLIRSRFEIYVFDEGLVEQVQPGSAAPGAMKTELTKVMNQGRALERDHDDCYLISTSGSSGEPKAILGSHKGLCHFIEWEIREFQLGRSSRVSWLSHPTFDVSLRDIFVPLCCGGTLVIPEESVKSDPRALHQWFEDQSISLTHIVPTLFRLLTDAIVGRSADRRILPSLELALIAGEPLYGFDIIRWSNILGVHTKLVNLYGPSETTLAKLYYPIDASHLEPNAIVPLGKPIPGARVFILKGNRICDIEEEGEICIETRYRSHGYFKNPDMTEKAFVKNPAVPGSLDVVYKTGDLGKMLRDGNIQFVGRNDSQVKLHGARVELGEIEVTLSQNPQVKLAAASLSTDDKGNQRLIAYLVPKNGQELHVESLRKHMAERLPDYMNPNLYMILDSLPLTSSGKIDRTRLPAPETTRPRLEQPYVRASNLIEEELVRLWGEVLGFQSVGIDDSFFDLGGNSILAARLADMIGGAFHIDVPIVRLFEFPKIRLLAKFIAREGPAESTTEDFEKRARQRRARRRPSGDS
jgi:amino acid adenylation domain-containing protein